MSKTGSDSKTFGVLFGKEMAENETFIENYEEIDENYDAFNSETFGESLDLSHNWDETEHEKLSSVDIKHDNKTHFNNNSFIKTNTNYNAIEDNFNENNEIEDDIHSGYDEIVVKNISKLGLEDDDFEDPAIMTFSRSGKPLSNSSVNVNPSERLRSCSPPSIPFLSYEDYSVSPKTQSIWSTTSLDSSLTSTVSSVKMRTLEDIEHDLINRNNDQFFQLSTIKRPIKAEELEANVLNQSSNQFCGDNRLVNNLVEKSDMGWSPFGNNAMHEFISNGRMSQEVDQQIGNRDNSRIEMKVNDSADAVIRMAAQQLFTEEPKKDAFDPIMKAQTLNEIERQLISGHEPQNQTQTQSLNMSNVSLPQWRPNVRPLVQTPNKPHYYITNPAFMRPPVMHFVPGMHPSVGRALFSPALIPNSQRIFPFPHHSRPIFSHPYLHLQHLQHLQQQKEHQQQHNQQFYNRNNNYSRPGNQIYESYDEDEYSGLMTQRDKEWLIKIQQLQTELKDPYVDDYYNVTYTSRKIAAKAAKDKDNKTTPILLLPERPKIAIEPHISSYTPIQFEGSLGKIQVSNVNCPRKLLDCSVNKTSNNAIESEVRVASKSEVSKFRKLLLEIEKLYLVLLNIDDEDKRIGALPEEARKSHFETRKHLCDKLYKGLTNETKDKINLEVVQIKKGLALLFRSLSYLSDQNERAVIISDLLNSTNYRQYIIKPKDRLDYGQMLVNAIYNINNHEILLKIVCGINNISLIIKSEYGHRIIESLITQFDKSEMSEDIKSKWSIFVNYVLDEVDDIPHLRKLCRNHLTNLGF